jgi:hypothetical protein
MKIKIRKSWWVNLYFQCGQLSAGVPYPTQESCLLMAGASCAGEWLGCKEIVFEHEEDIDVEGDIHE